MSDYRIPSYGLPAPEVTFDNVVQLFSMTPEELADEALLNDPKLYSHGKKSGRPGRCRRGCCWNPFRVCHYLRRCRCHAAQVKAETFIQPDGEVVIEFSEIHHEGLEAA